DRGEVRVIGLDEADLDGPVLGKAQGGLLQMLELVAHGLGIPGLPTSCSGSCCEHNFMYYMKYAPAKPPVMSRRYSPNIRPEGRSANDGFTIWNDAFRNDRGRGAAVGLQPQRFSRWQRRRADAVAPSQPRRVIAQ